jgi:hypothetical protein
MNKGYCDVISEKDDENGSQVLKTENRHDSDEKPAPGPSQPI